MQDASIIARLGLDTAGFKKGLGEAQTGIKNVASDLAGITALPFSLGGLALFAKQIVALGSELADTASAIGIDVVALQELQQSFAQSGAGAEDVRKALQKLAQTSTEARGGNEGLGKSFSVLGISVEELKALSLDQILMQIAASATQAHDPNERLAAIIDVLGRGGGKLAAGLNEGAGALQALRQSAIALTTAEVAALDALGDRVDRIIAKIRGSVAKQIISGPNTDFQGDIEALRARGALPTPPDLQKGSPNFYAALERAKEQDRQRQEAAAQAASKYKSDEKTRMVEGIAERAKALTEQMREETNNAFKLAEMEADQRAKAIEEEQELKKKNLDELLEKQRKGEEQLAEANAARDELLSKRKIERDEATLQDLVKQREGFVEGQLAGPDAAREATRETRRQGQLERRFERERNLKARGGRAAEDVPGFEPLPPLKKMASDLEDAKRQQQAKQDEETFKKALEAAEVLKKIAKNTEKLGVNL